MNKVYPYIGAVRLNSDETFDTPRAPVNVPEDALLMVQRAQPSKRSGSLVFTYVVDVNGSLWIADRHSEHMACAVVAMYFLPVR